jgi:hypothetical protein
MFCVPGKNAPVGDKSILARVETEDGVFYFRFGPIWSERHMLRIIPQLLRRGGDHNSA